MKRKTIPTLAALAILLSTFGVHQLHSVQVIGCTPPTFCADFNAAAVTPLTSAFTATANGGSPPFSYSWSFGDGSILSGNPVTHSFGSPNTYPVTLVISDSSGQSFTISHDVTELQNLPNVSFVTPSMPSWNGHVSCLASPATISRVIGSVANSNGGADLSGAGSTSLILKHTLNYPCENFGIAVFVEIRNVMVTYGPITTSDCSLVNGVNSCDVVGNIADFEQPCTVCLPGTIYMQEMRWEVERQWNASGYDGGSIDAYGLPSNGQQLDVQGFVYWSFLAPPDASHDYTGWYLELTAWRPAQTALSQCTLSDFNGNGVVNLFDLSFFALHYNTILGEILYDEVFDLNKDGRINLLDLSIFGLSYGEVC